MHARPRRSGRRSTPARVTRCPTKDGSDEDKADAHIRSGGQATQIGQHAVAIKHLARASALTSDPAKHAAVNHLRGACGEIRGVE